MDDGDCAGVASASSDTKPVSETQLLTAVLYGQKEVSKAQAQTGVDRMLANSNAIPVTHDNGFAAEKSEVNPLVTEAQMKVAAGAVVNQSSSRLAEGFNVYADGTFVGSSYATAYQVAGGGVGCYTVSAFDTAPVGESALSNEACIEEAGCPLPGDSNGDGELNVLDIVGTVNAIVSGTTDALECADVNGDGDVNVLDIVATVNIIVSGNGRISDATDARLIKSDNALNLKANGYIGGVQMTLSHGSDFSIKLTEDAMTAAHSTSGNQTTLVIVEPKSDELFVAEGEYEIVEMIVANSQEALDASFVPTSFVLSEAYPNPFNPTTSINLSIPEAGFVTVQVYNVMGQLVSTLADGYMDASDYEMTWDAGSFSSGLYFITATTVNNSSTQKVMLLK